MSQDRVTAAGRVVEQGGRGCGDVPTEAVQEAKTRIQRLRVVSDGTGARTHVYDAESGVELDHVTRVSFSIESSTRYPLEVEFMGFAADIEADAKVREVCPHCARDLPPAPHGSRMFVREQKP